MYNYSPYQTLAHEEFILHNVERQDVVLFLYTHPKAVIIGRNQNAWSECRIGELESGGGELARRISGGGAVYHDLGNLNFSFILNKNNYDLKRQLNVLCRGMAALGINAYVSGRNDVLAENRKFSGNAFCFKKDNAFHHGTILINTDKTALERYLNVNPQKIVSKGIDSVRSRVVNLAELKPEITVAKAAECLKNAFEEEYGDAERCHFYENDKQKIAQIAARNASEGWKYGENPKFDIIFERKFQWGLTEIHLSLKSGRVSDCKIYSDAMDADLILEVSDALKGVSYNKIEIMRILNALKNDPADKRVLDDLTDLFSEQNI